MQGSELVVRPVVLEGENSKRARLMQAVFGQKIGEDGAHLLEAEGDLAAFLLAGVGDYGEMGRVNFEPGGLGSGSAWDTKERGEEAYAERDRRESRHGRHAEGFKEMLPRPANILLKGPAVEGVGRSSTLPNLDSMNTDSSEL